MFLIKDCLNGIKPLFGKYGWPDKAIQVTFGIFDLYNTPNLILSDWDISRDKWQGTDVRIFLKNYISFHITDDNVKLRWYSQESSLIFEFTYNSETYPTSKERVMVEYLMNTHGAFSPVKNNNE